MKQIAYLIQTKLPNYKEYAFCAYNMPYNHLWEETKYMNWSNGTSFINLKAQYSNVPLNRQMIIDLFRIGKYYDGFLCAMVWGNIGTNLGGKKCFNNVFSTTNKTVIEKKIINVISLLQNGNITQAYQSLLSGGKNKIAGIREAFFTKLLYFAGGSICGLTPQPLIFDSVMQGLYKNFPNNNGSQPSRRLVNVYIDYCTKMEELRKLFFLPTAGHVEALLFCSGIRDYIFHRAIKF